MKEVIYMKINKQNYEQIKTKHNIKKMFVLCLVIATFKEQVDNVMLVELANLFSLKNKHRFYIFGKFKIRVFPESLPKMQLW